LFASKRSLQGLLVGDYSNLDDFLRFKQVDNKLMLQVDHDASTLANSEFHSTQTIGFENYNSTQQPATDLSVAINSSSA